MVLRRRGFLLATATVPVALSGCFDRSDDEAADVMLFNFAERRVSGRFFVTAIEDNNDPFRHEFDLAPDESEHVTGIFTRGGPHEVSVDVDDGPAETHTYHAYSDERARRNSHLDVDIYADRIEFVPVDG